MTPGWTSRSADAAATVDAAARWGRRRRTTADLADIERACAGLTSTLTALGGVAEDARKGLYRYSGGALLTHDELSPDDWQGHQDRGEAGVKAARSRLDVALKLLAQAATETAAAADEVGHLSSPTNNDDLAAGYALVDQLAAGMRPPRRLNIVPPADDPPPTD
jgi:hypothetical protein